MTFPALAAVPWRLVGAGAAVAALLLLGWRAHTWRESHRALPLVRAALVAEQSCAPESKCAQRAAAAAQRVEMVREEIASGYQAEIDRLRSRPARVVRVCGGAGPGNLPVPGTGPATDGTPAIGGGISGPAGTDIWPAIEQVGRDCDEVAARLRHLQRWNAALAKK